MTDRVDESLTTGLSFIDDDILLEVVVRQAAKPQPLWLRLRLITSIRGGMPLMSDNFYD